MSATLHSPLPATACHGPRSSAMSGPSAPAPGVGKVSGSLVWTQGDGAARDGTHRGTQALPSVAVRLHWGIGQVLHGVDGGSWAVATPYPHICVAAVLNKFSIYTFALWVFFFLFFFLFSQPSKCNSSTLCRAPLAQFRNTQPAAPQLQGKARSLALGGLPAGPPARQGQWPLTGTGCSRTCWASPPPPRRLRHCCTRRHISCAGAAARCSSRRWGRHTSPGTPPRPPAASSGR